MTINDPLTDLRSVLAGLYPTVEDARRVVHDAGLRPEDIVFQGKAINFWGDVLDEARKNRKMQAIIEVACKQYRDNEELARARDAYLQWVTAQSKPLESEGPRGTLPQTEEYVPPDRDVYIARDRHWDRDMVVETFIGMIRHDPKYPWRVLGIQGPKDADVDSLVDRLEEMCKKATTPRHLLYAKIPLRRGMPSIHDFALEVLNKLHNLAAGATHDVLCSQTASLMQGCNAIEQRLFSEPGPGGQRMGPSPYQVTHDLTDCLRQVAQHCTVVLLLQGFEKVQSSDVGKWLRDVWLIPIACGVRGLVIVVTGESGLGELKELDSSGIYCFDSLPSMTWHDFADWAREGCGLEWFTDDMAQRLHKAYHGSVSDFASYLVGARALAQVS